MSLRRLGITIVLALFCSISCSINSNSTYAKEKYRVVLRVDDSSTDTATLTLLRWNEDTLIGTATISGQGEFVFSGKEPLAPGEYCIKWNRQPVEFFVSDSKRKVNEQFVLQGKKIIHKKGALENSHFAGFQNLVNYEWKKLSRAADLENKFDSIGVAIKEIEKLNNSLFQLFMMRYYRGYVMMDGYYSNDTYAKYLTDPRIKNTGFGKEMARGFFNEFTAPYSSKEVIETTRNFIQKYNISKEMAALLIVEGFDFYKEIEIMGYEENACKLYEDFFKSGELKASDEKMFEMRTFYMLNKSSLLGMQAPQLNMQDTHGKMQSLHNIAKQSNYTILYFYTDDCLTCKVETPKLVNFVNHYKGSTINVFAVYTQDKKENWINYINRNLRITNPSVKWINIWDPKIETGFHMLYNVVSTPQMFLLDQNGTIIGRRLNAKAVEELITRRDYMLKELKK